MTVQEIWLTNLRRVVDQEAGGASSSNKRKGYRAVADATGFSEEFIYQLYAGKPKADGTPRLVSPALAEAIAKEFACGRDLAWFDQATPQPSLSHLDLPEALALLGQHLAELAPDQRAAAGNLLDAWARDGGSADLLPVLERRLSPVEQTAMPCRVRALPIVYRPAGPPATQRVSGTIYRFQPRSR